MKKYSTLIKAGLKRHRGSLSGIFLLLFFVSLSLGTVLTIWSNSGSYIRSEMERAGFGDLTAWISGVPDYAVLEKQLLDLEEVDRVEIQQVIYADYIVGEQESDSEGQLILYENGAGRRQGGRYCFFTPDLSGYMERQPEIGQGEIWVSPSMVSMFGLKIGDEITFPIARGGRSMTFVVKGYYEDPFMGSSMIGMKGFLVCGSDYAEAVETIEGSGIDALARDGAMFHIWASDQDGELGKAVTVSELNRMINENTKLQMYAEFTHSENAIYGFMLVLQNAFSGLLLAFVLVLLAAVVITMSHSLGSEIEADFGNMGILKTLGYTDTDLRRVQLLQYLAAILGGILAGIVFVIPISGFVSSITVTTTGILIPVRFPVLWCALSYLAVLTLLTLFIIGKSGSIGRITPMKAIRGEKESVHFDISKVAPIRKKGLHLRLACRQLMTGKRSYAGACLVAAVLVFFASLVGRMDAWLGMDGKGMMDAFNPADHDIGVQVFGNLTAQEAENMVENYTDITDSYLLAMPGVAVNGVDYTANVISEPERFHMMEGKSCVSENEIVLTEFAASDLGVMVGDTVIVTGDTGRDEYEVSGIYQCANDMGDNIGMSREGYLKIGQDNPHIWCYHYFLADPAMKQEITEALEDAYGGDVHVHENSWPGLYGIISTMRGLVIFMYGMVALFAFIVTAMTGSRILAAEKKDMGIYKAVGFTTGNLKTAFAIRFGLAALAGSIMGILFAAAVTDPLVSSVMKFAGISNFSSAPGVGKILFPAAVVSVLFTIFAYLSAGKIKRVDMTVLVAES